MSADHAMQVLHHETDPAHWRGSILCLSHSERAVDFERCGLNFLTQRYADPNRLPATTPFQSLAPSRDHSPAGGAITVWRFEERELEQMTLLAHLRPTGYRPQHAVWHNGRLWVLGVEVLEVYDSALQRVARIEDPWLAGAHTIAPDGRGRMLISCSASDAVLIVDAKTHDVTAAMRLPESLYGRNYALRRHDSVVEHFIHNDLQLTHVNCAWPFAGGVLVSTLIQGAVGWFDAGGAYWELLRGFVGCHGIRVDRRGRLYFCDSCTGTIVFLRWEPSANGAAGSAIERRLDVGSRWLHDALEVAPGLMLAAPADRNELVLLDAATGECRSTLPCDQYGESVQFLSCDHEPHAVQAGEFEAAMPARPIKFSADASNLA